MQCGHESVICSKLRDMLSLSAKLSVDVVLQVRLQGGHSIHVQAKAHVAVESLILDREGNLDIEHELIDREHTVIRNDLHAVPGVQVRHVGLELELEEVCDTREASIEH